MNMQPKWRTYSTETVLLQSIRSASISRCQGRLCFIPVMLVRTIAVSSTILLTYTYLSVGIGSVVMLQMLSLSNKVAKSFDCHQQDIHI